VRQVHIFTDDEETSKSKRGDEATPITNEQKINHECKGTTLKRLKKKLNHNYTFVYFNTFI